METIISELVNFETQYLAPFFKNNVLLLTIAAAVYAIFIAPSENIMKTLFNNTIYRLIWIIFIILLTSYDPIIGILLAIAYLTHSTNTENFKTENLAMLFEEQKSIIDQQFEIVDNKKATNIGMQVLNGLQDAQTKQIIKEQLEILPTEQSLMEQPNQDENYKAQNMNFMSK